jgi:hypothetical protein
MATIQKKKRGNPSQRKRKDADSQYSYEQATAEILRGSRMLHNWFLNGAPIENLQSITLIVKLTQLADWLRTASNDPYQTNLYLLFWNGITKKLPMKKVFAEMEEVRRGIIRWQKSKEAKTTPHFVVADDVNKTGERAKWKTTIKMLIVQKTAQLLYEDLQKVYRRQGAELKGVERIDHTLIGMTADHIFAIMRNNT